MVKAVRLLLLAIASVMVLSCGQAHSSGIRYLIGVSQSNLSEPWRIAMTEEIKAVASQNSEVRVIVTDAADSSKKQIADVTTLLKYGIDLLIISPNEAAALTPAVEEAYRRIPVIVLDRAVEDYNYTLFIGPDNEQIGRQAGRYVSEVLGGTGGRVVEIEGQRGSPPTLDRSRGFKEELTRNASIRLVSPITADWLRDLAQQRLGEKLGSLGTVDIVFAQNDAMALGAYRAIDKAGLQGISIIGVDGLPGPDGGIDLVKRGLLAATFICPTGGEEAMYFALDILNHKEGIPKKIFLRTRLVTKGNIDKSDPLLQKRSVSADSPPKTVTMGFAQVGHESSWRAANTKSITDSAARSGIKLIFVDGQQDQQAQIRAIRSFIAAHVDIIAFSPIVEYGWEAVLREAKAAGIPVILTDRRLAIKDDTLWLSLLGSDFVEEGRRAARYLLGKFASSPPQPAAIRVVELEGTIGSAPAIDRKAGFGEVISADPRFTIVESVPGDFTIEDGEAQMKALLARWGRGIDVVFSHNDDMALGAIKAIEAFGLKPGVDIVIVSVDAVRKAFEAMLQGKLNCTVECTPLLGPQLMKAVQDYMAGQMLPSRIVTSEEVFPAETAKQEIDGRKY